MMHISQFLSEEITRGTRFLKYWQLLHAAHPDIYLMELPRERWIENLDTFGNDDEHSLVVIGPDMARCGHGIDLRVVCAICRDDPKKGTVSGRVSGAKPNTGNRPKTVGPDRNELIDQQNWNVNTLIELAERFIEGAGMDDTFDSFLNDQAQQENQSG